MTVKDGQMSLGKNVISFAGYTVQIGADTDTAIMVHMIKY